MNGVKAVARAVAATVASAAMLGATVAGAAFAADFGGFPAPFVQNGAFNGKLVVGANAMPADVVGAIGIAAALGQSAFTAGTATGTGKATVSVSSADGIRGEVLLGQQVYDADDFSGKLPLKNNRFSALKKWTGSDLKYKDTTTEIAAHQEIEIDSSGIQVARGDSDAAAGKFYLKVPSSELKVKMVFDTVFNESLGDVVFDLLGKEITLEAVGTDSVTVSAGTKHSVSLDNPTFTDSASGATVTFKGADTNGAKAYVTVTTGSTTDSAVLDSGVEKTVAGIALKATDIFRMSDTSMFSTLTVGNKLSDDISTGEKFLGEANWELLTLTSTATTLTSFTVAYTPSSTSFLAPGEKLSGLFGGFDLKVDSQLVPDSSLVTGFAITKETSPNIYRDNSTLRDTSAAGLKFVFPKADVAQLVNGTDIKNDGTTGVYLDTAYAGATLTSTLTFYPDTTDATASYLAVSNSSNLLVLTYSDTKVRIGIVPSSATLANVTVNVTKTDGTSSELFYATVTLASGDVSQIAQGTGDPNSNDLVYTGSITSATTKGTFEYPYYTDFGVKIETPKTDLKAERVRFSVPSEPNKYVVILGKDTTIQEQIAAGQTGLLSKVKIDAITVDGATTMSKVPISAPVAVLDTEVTDRDMNMVLVGGPSVNSLVKALGGVYASAATYSGVGKLFWVDGGLSAGKAVVVVAGWDADNTRAAAYVLANYDKHALAGKTEVTVTGKELSSLTVE
ncbi:MAG: S-layer protein [archaeon]